MKNLKQDAQYLINKIEKQKMLLMKSNSNAETDSIKCKLHSIKDLLCLLHHQGEIDHENKKLNFKFNLQFKSNIRGSTDYGICIFLDEKKIKFILKGRADSKRYNLKIERVEYVFYKENQKNWHCMLSKREESIIQIKKIFQYAIRQDDL